LLFFEKHPRYEEPKPMAKTQSKPRPPRKPPAPPVAMAVAEPDDFTPVPLPECVSPVELPATLVETVTPAAEPVELSAVLVDAPVEPQDQQTRPLPIDHAARVSCGKFVARKLGLAPAHAQARAQLLDEDTVRAVLALQLEADPAPRIRGLLGI
jgi:hypothetical protein